MPAPRKFKALFPRIKIVNRCVLCGKIIPLKKGVLCIRCAIKVRRST